MVAAEAEMRLEVGYKGSSLHWCGLINHCPLPPPWAERLFLSVQSVLCCHMPADYPVSWKGGEKKAIRAFFGPTDMKSHQDRNEDFINLHGCSVSAEQLVFRDICTVSVPHLYTRVFPVLALPGGT